MDSVEKQIIDQHTQQMVQQECSLLERNIQHAIQQNHTLREQYQRVLEEQNR